MISPKEIDKNPFSRDPITGVLVHFSKDVQRFADFGGERCDLLHGLAIVLELERAEVSGLHVPLAPSGGDSECVAREVEMPSSVVGDLRGREELMGLGHELDDVTHSP
jgi:hypothetical protein